MSSLSSPNKRARYIGVKEALFAGEQQVSVQPLGILDLFGNRNSLPSASSPRAGALKHVQADKNNKGGNSNVVNSTFYTFRLEHRIVRGDLAQYQGEERILLFASDRPGAIGKIVYSSVQRDSSFSTLTDERKESQMIYGDHESDSVCCPIITEAKIHVVEVKEHFRGYDLGSLLVTVAMERLCRTTPREEDDDDNSALTLSLAPKLLVPEVPLPIMTVRIHLDAEEDSRRHNKLLAFYQLLGFGVKPHAKILYLNNNDGETIRKIPMQRTVAVAVRPVTRSGICSNKISVASLLLNASQQPKRSSTFLPVSLCSPNGRRLPTGCLIQQQQALSSRIEWLIVDDGSGFVSFCTTMGRVLCFVDENGGLVLTSCETSYDTNSYHVDRGGEEIDDKSSLVRFKLIRVHEESGAKASADANDSSQLWLFQTTRGTFLACNPIYHYYHNHNCNQSLHCSKSPILWQSCDGMRIGSCRSGHLLVPPRRRRLVCTGDSLFMRWHYRQQWQCQTVEYVRAMRVRFATTFTLKQMTLRQALDMAKSIPADPYYYRSCCYAVKAARDFHLDDDNLTTTNDNDNSSMISLQSLCFRTAELFRTAGHPDWVQLLGLVYHFGRLLICLDSESSFWDYDWTIACEALVVGCPAPASAKYYPDLKRWKSEANDFHNESDGDNDDNFDSSCCHYKDSSALNTGMYHRQHCGLEQVLLTFTGPEYMYHMLKFNQVQVPEEGLQMVRLASLVDWHSRGAYQHLASDDDAAVQPFVVDFQELVQLGSWEGTTIQTATTGTATAKTTGDLLPMHAECEQLWYTHYADIASKYEMDGSLMW